METAESWSPPDHILKPWFSLTNAAALLLRTECADGSSNYNPLLRGSAGEEYEWFLTSIFTMTVTCDQLLYIAIRRD